MRRQCELSDLSRASVCRPPAARDPEDLVLMRRLDALYLTYPYCGSVRMVSTLGVEGHRTNRKRVQRLMRRIDRPNRVWCANVTCMAMAQGFMDLMVIMDWARRRVLAWQLSNTLDASFCVAALEEALTKGKPEIFDTDQGAQFTSAAFTDALRSGGIAIGMDGRGRWIDNVFVERLWRSLKYEEIHLRDDANALEARAARLWACGRPKGVAHMPRGPTAAAKRSLIRQPDNPSRRQSYQASAVVSRMGSASRPVWPVSLAGRTVAASATTTCALARRVAIADAEVRIVGSETELLRTPVTASGGTTGVAGVQRSRKGNGAAERIRTPNPQIRSLMLYPVELRPHASSRPSIDARARNLPARRQALQASIQGLSPCGMLALCLDSARREV